MKLSVIIPVYRVAETLERCIESIAGQMWDDMEIILVDDGSPDECPAICDQWAGRDARIRVVHKENGGLSDARNAGLDVADGDYITFVDSDDYLAPDTYRELMSDLAQREGCDILEYPAVIHYGNPHQQYALTLSDTTYTTFNDYWLKGKAYSHTYAWNKIYRARLFENVRFPKGRLFEDALTLPLLVRQAGSIVTTSKGLYYYCDNPKGIAANAGGNELSNLLESHVAVIKSGDIDTGCPAFRHYYSAVLNIQLSVYDRTGRQPILPPYPFAHTPKLFLRRLLGTDYLCKLHSIYYKMTKR